MTILTLAQVKELGLKYKVFENGDYSYQTKDGFWHFIRDGVDLLAWDLLKRIRRIFK